MSYRYLVTAEQRKQVFIRMKEFAILIKILAAVLMTGQQDSCSRIQLWVVLGGSINKLYWRDAGNKNSSTEQCWFGPLRKTNWFTMKMKKCLLVFLRNEFYCSYKSLNWPQSEIPRGERKKEMYKYSVALLLFETFSDVNCLLSLTCSHACMWRLTSCRFAAWKQLMQLSLAYLH